MTGIDHQGVVASTLRRRVVIGERQRKKYQPEAQVWYETPIPSLPNGLTSVNLYLLIVLGVALSCFLPRVATSQESQSEARPTATDAKDQAERDLPENVAIEIVSEQRLDTVVLGKITPQETGVFRYRIENPVDVSLTCISLERSCQCSNARVVSKGPLEPKGFVEIEITVDAKGKQGQAEAELYFQLAATESLESGEQPLKIYRWILPFQFWVSGEGGFASNGLSIELDPKTERAIEYAGFNFSDRPWTAASTEVVLRGVDQTWSIPGEVSAFDAASFPPQKVKFVVPASLCERILASEVQGTADLYAASTDSRVFKKIVSVPFSGTRVEELRIVPPVLTLDPSSEWVVFHVISPTNTLKVSEAAIEVVGEGEKRRSVERLELAPKQHGWVTAKVATEELSLAEEPLVVMVTFKDGVRYRMPMKVLK